MSEWYDRKGKLLVSNHLKVGSKNWHAAMRRIERLLSDYNYKIVKVTPLWWGGRVSTVWLGLDHSFNLKPKHTPIIFETMVFPPRLMKRWFGEDMDRYATEEQAVAGHWKMYREWSNPLYLMLNVVREVQWQVQLWKARRSK
jgi:hypothetical protein